MSEGNANQTTEKTFTQKDIDVERAHAQAAKAELDELRSKFKDIDPAKYGELKTQLDTLMRERAAKGGDKEREDLEAHLKNEYETRYASKYTDLETRASSAETELKRLRVRAPAMTAAATMIAKDSLPLVESLIERELGFVDGEIVAVDDKGRPLASEDNPRNPKMALDEYLRRLVSRYPSIALNKQLPGTGDRGVRSSSGGSSGSAALPPDLARWAPEKQREFFQSNPEARKAFLNNAG
jgi:hypothetical protein